jgi:hypothetical protein
MGAPKKYTAETLARAVKRYFKSITRERQLTEKKPTGQKDEMGHMIYEDVPVINAMGKPVIVTEYLIPPTVGGLSEFLGIHRDTWNDYCNPDKHPEFSDTTTYARGRIHAYLEREMLTRQGKDLKGVIFNLENNFGYREKLDVSSDSIEHFLEREAAEGQVHGF